MKKPVLFSVLFFLFISFVATAQTEKGSKMIGGNANIQFNNPFSISLNPQVGFFVVDNLAIGSGINLFYVNSSQQNNYKYHGFGTGLSPFVRYYFGKQTPVRLFTQAYAGFNRQWNTSSYNSVESKSSSNNSYLGVGLGVAYFVSDHIGLEALLNYSNSESGSSGREGNLGLRVGFQIYLPSSSSAK